MTRLVNYHAKESSNLTDIQSVFTDATYLSKVIKAYSSNVVARPSFQSHEIQSMFVNLGRTLFRQAREALRNNQSSSNYELSMLNISMEELKRAILMMSFYGLDLSPERGHVYFVPELSESSGVVNVATVLGVKGMSNLMSRAHGVMGVEARCIYQSDTFIFNGTFEKPTFSRSVFSGEERSEEKLTGGYFLLHYTNGNVFCSEISGERLLEMANDARSRYLDENGQVWDSMNPWFTSHKEVMFDHLVMRHGFRSVCERTDLLALNIDESGRVSDVREDVIEGKENADFERAIKEFNSIVSKPSQGQTLNSHN